VTIARADQHGLDAAQEHQGLNHTRERSLVEGRLQRLRRKKEPECAPHP
jgi:hypothetical protein